MISLDIVEINHDDVLIRRITVAKARSTSVGCVHKQAQRTSTTGQRKNTRITACRLKREKISQKTSRVHAFESGPTTSLAETGNHGLSQRRDTKSLSQRRQGEKVGSKTSRDMDSQISRDTWITDSRAHGVFSTRGQNVAAFATSQRLADHKATKCIWLGITCHVKDNKT